MQLFVTIFLIPFLILASWQVVFAQEAALILCANPEHTQADFEAYRQRLEDFHGARGNYAGREVVVTTDSQSYAIPVHIYIINYDDGTPPHPTIDALSRFNSNLSYTNEVFPEQISFYIYKLDYVNSTQLINKQDPMVIYNGIIQINPAYAENNAIRVFINAEPYSRGDFPYGVKLPAKAGPVTTAHEFGHHFGLYHTFNKTIRVIEGNACISYFTNNEPNYLCPPADGFPESGALPLGNYYGDLINDTAVDPGGGFCESVSPFWCALPPCETMIDGEEYVYQPPYYNVMSYWSSFRTFTTEQKQRMIDVLENPSLGIPPIGGDMSFLIDENIPEPEDTMNQPVVTGLGFVDRVAWNHISEQFELTPFPRARIKCDFPTSQSVTAFILGGVFIDTNIPVMAQLNNPSFLEFNTFSASYTPAIPCVVPVDDIWQAGYDITMLDIVAIQRHILGIKELPKPYSWIAADVNNSGSITTLDAIILQQVILGLRTSFGNVPTYRIIPRYALSNESPFSVSFFANPFTAVWDRNGVLFSYSGTQSYMDRFRLDLPNEAIQAPQTFSFIAIKTGDVYQ